MPVKELPSTAARATDPKPCERVNHPVHYGGADNPYEAIKVIEAWGLGFNDGNAVKYIARAGKKDPSTRLEDIQKAVWYLNREVAKLEAASGNTATAEPNRRPALPAEGEES